MSIISIKDLTKIYNASQVPVHAVNGISLEFERGEFAAIVGPSGSGKTTLLNMLGGLDDPTSGTIVIDNQRLDQLKSSERIKFRLNNIGFIFQAYNLIPVLTARENIEFIMELQKIPKEQREKRSMELLEAVGIPDKANIRPRQLSGGQQQRIAVARALASRPKFILADEPTANLDSKSTGTLLDIMEKLNREEDITFIFSTHDARVVNKARRVITIEDGRVKNDEVRQ
ncbi:ABC transporter ATP-binding protein [Marinilabiliaceae bacterium JC017]|nr:ABC transporter ATP-binding protein [Marinilabiliaceae bacterium JC017]